MSTAPPVQDAYEEDAPANRSTPIGRAAARLRITEGQLYSVSIGLLLAVGCAAFGLPPVLRGPTSTSVAEAEFVPLGGRSDPGDAPAPSTVPPDLSVPPNGPVTTGRLDVGPRTASSDPALEPVPQVASPTTTAPAPTTSSTAPVPRRPLAVVDAGYFSAQAGTPLATTGVPTGSLPVGVRAGQRDKYVFFRLRGDAGPLVLRLVAGGSSGTGAIVRLCPTASPSWTPRDASGAPDSPGYTVGPACVTPVVEGDSYRFDLTGHGDVTAPHGFAVVPVESPAATFQLAFSRTAG